jgi:hypothetical protein
MHELDGARTTGEPETFELTENGALARPTEVGQSTELALGLGCKVANCPDIAVHEYREESRR